VVNGIVVESALCSGCRACQVACVAWHEGRFGTAAARIQVTKIEAQGLDKPHVCRLCLEPACVDACPSDALYRDATSGGVLVVTDECTGCASCIEACPYGAVSLHPETGQAQICDLCGGDPACVKRCATGAIAYAHPKGAPAPAGRW
jgi:Fe-S-cluster-containing dehydrogenase component